MSHLLKLKKDGKTVGFLKIGTVFSIQGIWFSKDDNSWERCPQKIIDGDFDSTYPFVCKDKNSKDVFAGDKAKWTLPDDTTAPGQEEELEAAVTGGFLVFDVEGIDFVEASQFGNIELIEENQCEP